MRRIILEENRKKNPLAENFSQNPKILKFACLGTILFLVIFSVEIWIVNRLSTEGDKIYQLKEAKSKLELENQIIANLVAKESSMVILENKAIQLGFNNINQIEYIKTSDSIASAK